MTTPSLFPSTASSAPPLQQPNAAPAPSPLAPAAAGALTLDEVRKALPVNLRVAATQNLVDMVNNIATDPLVAETIRKNFIGYTAVLKDGKYKTEDYVNAVAYVSYKLMGYSNEDAYARTFPTRYASLVARGLAKKDIAAYVAGYSKGKLVNTVLEQTLVPTWVLNQDLHQQAINRLATLMTTANSEKVQADAAIGLLNALKKPETKEFQINMQIEDNSGMKELKNSMADLARQQQELIRAQQMKTIDVAAKRLNYETDDV